MIAAVCGGFLFVGGILALGFGMFGDLAILGILGLLCIIGGLGNLIHALSSYYRDINTKSEDKGDVKDDA